MKGKLTITRPNRLENEIVEIVIRDESCKSDFVKVEVSLDDFTRAITGQARIDMDFTVRDLDAVGQRKVVTRRSEVLPSYLQNCYTKETVVEWLIGLYEDENTYVDTYLGSQKSFTVNEDGDRVVNFRTYEYLED